MKYLYLFAGCLLLLILAFVLIKPSAKGSSSQQAQPVAASVTLDTLNASPEIEIQEAYSFDEPQASFKLDSELKEISGLTVLDANRLAAVQDEKGKVFQIDLHTGEILQEDRFEKDGDYEGIERIDSVMYVLRSDGDVFRVDGWPPKSKNAKKFETALSTKYDTEGLAYDARTRRLLIACKEYAGDNLKGYRAIYSFDPATGTLDEKPTYTIDLKQLEKLTPDHPLNRTLRKLAAPLTDLDGFKPAAIAVHPITGHLFVVSSVRKILLAINPRNEIESLWVLPDSLFKQPEGLAFLPNGDLFISNEGRGGKATLLRFNYRAE